MYTRESLETLKKLVNPKDILSTFGGVPINRISENADEFRCPCPLHGGDNASAFRWKKSTGTWVCYTHSCGGEESKDVFSFLKLKAGLGFNDAAQKIAAMYGFKLENGVDLRTGEFFSDTTEVVREYYLKRKFEKSELRKLYKFPGYHEEGFETVFQYLNSRKYDYKEVKCFNFYPHLDNYNILRMGIPVYDENNALVGINSRLMDTIVEYPESIEIDGVNQKIPKYKMTKFPKSSILYNLNNAKKYSVTKGIIIVEGQLDVVRLYTYGFKNAVCTMGTSLSPQQVGLLYKHCFCVTFLVEEGKPAWDGVLKSIKQLNKGMKIRIAKLPSGDADSNTKEVVVDTLVNAEELSAYGLKKILTV